MRARLARLALAGLAFVLVWGLLPSSAPAQRRVPPAGSGDAALYKKVVQRLSVGEAYYDALGTELRLDNYPASSPFNWRTPFHLVLVARLAPPRAALLLQLLSLAAVLATVAVLARISTHVAVAGIGAQLGALATAFQPDATGVAEIWAGVFIALSASAYYRSWWLAGAMLGITAVFLRELAAPYCVVCGILAIRHRRREAGVWIVAGMLYAAYYALHIVQVQAHQLPADIAHTESWQRWNGLQFLVATVGVNGWLGFVPRWAAVLFMTAALAGVASKTIAPQIRGALLLYFVLFAFVGLPFNYYWGFVTAPVWAFGFAHWLEGVGELVRAARVPRSRA